MNVSVGVPYSQTHVQLTWFVLGPNTEHTGHTPTQVYE